MRALLEERDRIRARLQEHSGAQFNQWAELERRACIAEQVGRKVTPSARRTVDGTLAAVRSFAEGLSLH
ncbi:MAG: hypothetical protein Q8L48_30640 [Archangium sp.]|nr:hypothetical protein [Archangium sp.]